MATPMVVGGDPGPTGRPGARPATVDASAATSVPAAGAPAAPQGTAGDTAGAISADAAAGEVLTDAQASELVRGSAFATDAGWGFYAVGDELRHFANAIRPTPGYVTVDLHGSPRGFTIDGHRLTPEQFGHALRGLIDSGVASLPDGAGLKLLSCDTAFGGESSPAARLARALGVEVIAPDQPVWTGLDGKEIVSSPVPMGGVFVPKFPPDGQWHRFGPGGVEVPLDFNPGYHGDFVEGIAQSDPSLGGGADSDRMPRAPDGSSPVDVSSLVGADPRDVIASIPEGWIKAPSRNGGGVVFRDPEHPGRQVRIMPGYAAGNRPDPLTHGPYAEVSQNGTKVKVALLGNPTLGGSQ